MVFAALTATSGFVSAITSTRVPTSATSANGNPCAMLADSTPGSDSNACSSATMPFIGSPKVG